MFMYLTALQFTNEDNLKEKCLLNAEYMHKSILATVDSDRALNNVLYRILPIEEKHDVAVFLQSDIQPHETDHFSFLLTPLDISSRIASVSPGCPISFNVIARPHRGSRRLLIKKQEERIRWIASHFANNGAVVESIHEGSRISYPFQHTAHDPYIRLNGYVYTGTITITDTKAFERLCRSGLGRWKNYGFGLILLS